MLGWSPPPSGKPKLRLQWLLLCSKIRWMLLLICVLFLLPQWEFLKQPSRRSASSLWTCWGRAQSCSAPHGAAERRNTVSVSVHTREKERDVLVYPQLTFWENERRKKTRRRMKMRKSLIVSLCNQTIHAKPIYEYLSSLLLCWWFCFSHHQLMISVFWVCWAPQ